MFELVFLGTSASAPSVQRGLSSAIVMINEHRFMIDCGEGTQRQILRSGLGFRRLDKILLTHGHLHHILGIGGLASTLGRWEALDELNIFGGAATLARVELLMEVVFGSNQIPNVGVALNLMQAGIVFADRHFTLSAFPVQHRGLGMRSLQRNHRYGAKPHSGDSTSLVNHHASTATSSALIHQCAIALPQVSSAMEYRHRWAGHYYSWA